jgi:hypothetical protein
MQNDFCPIAAISQGQTAVRMPQRQGHGGPRDSVMKRKTAAVTRGRSMFVRWSARA